MGDFYVYVWRRPCGTPFYVGKGMGDRDRKMFNRNNHFLRVVAKIRRSGAEPIIERVQEGLTDEEAKSLEIALIEKYGRKDKLTGVLVNLTDGGDGKVGSTRSAITSAMFRMKGPKAGKKYKGTTLHRPSGRWAAAFRIGGITKSLGYHATEEESARAYDAAAYAEWGSNCYLNFPESLSGQAPTIRSVSETMRISGPRSGRKFKGVSMVKPSGKWKATIVLSGRAEHRGVHDTPEQAARAYDKAAIEAFGVGNCYLNFPEEHGTVNAFLVCESPATC